MGRYARWSTWVLVGSALASTGTNCDPPPAPVAPPFPSNTSLEVCGGTTTDPLIVADVWVDGDIMHAKVRYAGGCSAHSMFLCWDGGWVSGNPMQTSMFVDHDANGDTCSTWIEETLSWDVRSLREDTQSFWPSADRLLVVFPTETLEWRF